MNPLFNFIADGLAENGYAVCDQFLSQNEVDAIVGLEHFQEGINSFQKAGIGKKQGLQINEAIRGDYIQWVCLPQPDWRACQLSESGVVSQPEGL
jgi:SM-20-related protein